MGSGRSFFGAREGRMAVCVVTNGGRRGRVRCDWRGVLVSEDGQVLWDRFARLKHHNGQPHNHTSGGNKLKEWRIPDPGILGMRVHH